MADRIKHNIPTDWEKI